MATSEDLEAVLYVADEVSKEKKDDRGADIFARFEGLAGMDPQALHRALLREDQILIVGEFDGVVLGYGVATVETLNDGGKLGRLEALAVVAEARAVGIGEAMMNTTIGILRSADCFAIDAPALPGDRWTKNFFEGFGMKARLLTLSKAL